MQSDLRDIFDVNSRSNIHREVGVYYDRKGDEFWIQLHDFHHETGINVATDRFLRLSSAAMSKDGLPVILNSLRGRSTGADEVPWPFGSPASIDAKAFKDRYGYRLILAMEPSRIVVLPLDAELDDDRRANIDLPCSSDEFVRVLMTEMDKR